MSDATGGERIDWENLPVLRPRRVRDPLARERLAAESHKKNCAKHKGRNHWASHQRRQMAAAKKRRLAKRDAATSAAYSRYLDMVRDYWAGICPVHPDWRTFRDSDDA